jgi:hypothetical protein
MLCKNDMFVSLDLKFCIQWNGTQTSKCFWKGGKDES